MKRYLLLLFAMVLLLSGCQSEKLSRIDVSPTASLDLPAVTPFLSAQTTITPQPDGEYVDDPALLNSDTDIWAKSVTMSFVDADVVSETTSEIRATAKKLVTPTAGYTVYLIEGYKFGEREDGVNISYGGNNWLLSTVGLHIQSYPVASDEVLQQKIEAWMKMQNTELARIEEEPDDPAFIRVYHGTELPGNVGRRTMACELNTANADEGQTVIAFMVYNKDQPELLQNVQWMAKSFRLR